MNLYFPHLHKLAPSHSLTLPKNRESIIAVRENDSY
jgi:hypothetical protein